MTQRITGGVWPAMLTAVDQQGKPDFAAIDQLVELFVEQQMDGLFVLGSTGQGPAIDIETRKTIGKHVIDRAAGRIIVMMHVGAVSTHDSVELAKHAADCGADAISSVPPIYYPVDFTLTYEHYRLIAEAGGLPFFPYHAGFTSMALPPTGEYMRRMSELPHFAGMKLTESDLMMFTQIRNHLGDGPVLFSGFDQLMAPALFAGSSGAIGSFLNVFGPAFKRVNDRLRNHNDIAVARSFTAAFNDLVAALVPYRADVFGFISRAMDIKYGIDIGPGRTPLTLLPSKMSDDEVRRWIDRVDESAGIEATSAAR
jgi:N-acetylneuraminate lyase